MSRRPHFAARPGSRDQETVGPRPARLRCRQPARGPRAGRAGVQRPPQVPAGPCPAARTGSPSGGRSPPPWPAGPSGGRIGVTNLVFPFFGVLPGLAADPAGAASRCRPASGCGACSCCWCVFSGFAIDVDVVGAATSEGIGRYFAFGLPVLNYLAVTVMMLFVGNMTEEELPRRRIIKWMCSARRGRRSSRCAVPVLPELRLRHARRRTSCPVGFRDEGSAIARLSQLQPVLGEASPRPSAPFPFTNAWGNNLSLLLVWLVVALGRCSAPSTKRLGAVRAAPRGGRPDRLLAQPRHVDRDRHLARRRRRAARPPRTGQGAGRAGRSPSRSARSCFAASRWRRWSRRGSTPVTATTSADRC